MVTAENSGGRALRGFSGRVFPAFLNEGARSLLFSGPRPTRSPHPYRHASPPSSLPPCFDTLMASKPFHVLIIGGGIAGPALALALQKVGISSAIYEGYAFTDLVGGGFSIAPNGVHILDTIGVYQQLKDQVYHATTSYFKDENGKTIIETPFGDERIYGVPSLSMSRALLYRTLAQALKERNVPVYYEKRLVSYEEKADGVLATFEDGTTASGSILIGADGIKSVVRKQMLPNGPEPGFTGVVGVGGFIPVDELPPLAERELNGFSFHFGPQGFFGWGGAEKGTLMWWSNYLRATPYTREECVAPDWKDIKDDLLAKFATWPSPIPFCIAKTQNLLRQNIFDIESLPQWYQGRVLLIGDAAHAVSPNSGQGASLALEDALMITKLLRDHQCNYLTAFPEFVALRKDRCEMIVQGGRQQASNKAEVGWLASKIRNWFIYFAFKLGFANKIKEIMKYRIYLDETPAAAASSSTATK